MKYIFIICFFLLPSMTFAGELLSLECSNSQLELASGEVVTSFIDNDTRRVLFTSKHYPRAIDPDEEKDIEIRELIKVGNIKYWIGALKGNNDSFELGVFQKISGSSKLIKKGLFESIFVLSNKVFLLESVKIKNDYFTVISQLNLSNNSIEEVTRVLGSFVYKLGVREIEFKNIGVPEDEIYISGSSAWAIKFSGQGKVKKLSCAGRI